MTATRPAASTAAPPATALSVGVASSGLVLAALPIFLVGGLAVQIRAELGFTEAALGAAVSGAFLTGACAGPLAGRLADRIGARGSIVLGGALSVAALIGIGGWGRGLAHVAIMLAVSGVGFAVTDPGLSVLLHRGVPHVRQGLAFGIKEASIPAATLAAGIAVPAIALTAGWRWAFAVGILPVAALAVLLPRVRLSRRAPAPQPAAPGTTVHTAPPRGALIAVTAAAGLGIGAASGVGVFLTQSAVAMGMAPGSAGVLLAVGSVAGIGTRILVGANADRHGGEQLGIVSWMLFVGAAAMALGATGATPLLVVATIGTFSAGWGWSGLLFLSLVRAHPGSPGAAAGIGVAGLAAGNGLGPVLFGVAAESLSYGAAWLCAAAATVVAAVLLRLARPRFATRDGAAR